MYLEIEDLASNALIELMKAKNERFVSYKDMEIYGEAVAKSIIGNGDGAILLLSRDRTTALYESYPELFEERAVGRDSGVFLREGKSEADLKRFRGWLPLKALIAFVSSDAQAVLGIYENERRKT